MDDSNKNPRPEVIKETIEGSEGLLKNLTTFPESNQQREDLIDRLQLSPQQDQSAGQNEPVETSAQTSEGRDDTQ